MILSLLGSLFGGIWKLAKLVPWYVWVAAVVAGYGWHWHSGKVEAARDAGVQQERAAWVAAQDKAKADAKAEAERQQAKIDKDAAVSREAADKHIARAKAETETLREKLRHANQPNPGATLSIPANCRISPERRDLLNQALGYSPRDDP